MLDYCFNILIVNVLNRLTKRSPIGTKSVIGDLANYDYMYKHINTYIRIKLYSNAYKNCIFGSIVFKSI